MQDLIFQNVTGAEGPDFVKEKQDVVLLDVRQPEEFKWGHIPGSVLIPLGELELRLNELDKDKEYLVYCRSGRRSITACHILNQYGFEKLYNLKEGILGWQGEVVPG